MAKERISARISPIAKRLLEEEQKQTGDSEGEILERCLYSCAKTPSALRIIEKGVEEDPNLKPLVDALFLAMRMRETEVHSARETGRNHEAAGKENPPAPEVAKGIARVRRAEKRAANS